jgi:hypothetical protein
MEPRDWSQALAGARRPQSDASQENIGESNAIPCVVEETEALMHGYYAKQFGI